MIDLFGVGLFFCLIGWLFFGGVGVVDLFFFVCFLFWGWCSGLVFFGVEVDFWLVLFGWGVVLILLNLFDLVGDDVGFWFVFLLRSVNFLF